MASRAFNSANGLLSNESDNNLSSGTLLFRTNTQELKSNTTIETDVNAMVAGPITITSDAVTLTVKGNLSIV